MSLPGLGAYLPRCCSLRRGQGSRPQPPFSFQNGAPSPGACVGRRPASLHEWERRGTPPVVKERGQRAPSGGRGPAGPHQSPPPVLPPECGECSCAMGIREDGPSGITRGVQSENQRCCGGKAALKGYKPINPSQHGRCQGEEAGALAWLVRSLLGTCRLAREEMLRNTAFSTSETQSSAHTVVFPYQGKT